MPRPAPELKLTLEPLLEETEQADLIDRCARNEYRYPELAWLFHIPNGGWRGVTSGRKMKRQGVRPGVPDLCLPVMRVNPVTGEVHGGLFIEMKRVSGSVVSPEQKAYIEFLRGRGYAVFVCRGCEAAWKVLLWYLSLPVYAPPAAQPTMP